MDLPAIDEKKIGKSSFELNEQETSSKPIPSELPVLPLRDTIVYPGTMFPLLVGRESSLKAIDAGIDKGKFVLLLGQKNPDTDNPKPEDLYTDGCIAAITQVLRLPNSLVKVLVNGILPAKVKSLTENEGYLTATTKFKLSATRFRKTERLASLVRKTRDKFERFVIMNQEVPEEVLTSLDEGDEYLEPNLYLMASHLDMSVEERQKFLELETLEQLYRLLLAKVTRELQVLVVSTEINEKVQEEIQETQRRFFIQEQIRALQDELDEGEVADPELQKLKEQIETAKMPEEAHAKAMEELERLKKTPQMSPEYGVGRNYLDWMTSLPWSTASPDNLDIQGVQDVLEKEHYGLEKPKDRILEHIAVLNLVENLKGQILCFVGPPGVGKTSMAKSIARALNRKMVRISLGGVSDEAEIRGHRRTYIGSMPGRIIQGMRKAGTVNPVMILDEIDKVGHDFRGDPSSAILEVLDPEQNNTFNDHYLDMDYDLSRVMFIATANVASSIQPALLDRMEIINLPGYLEHEKLEIAKRHLIPKMLKSHGLKASQVRFHKSGILHLIRNYTSEAGVRTLEQQVAAVCRKIARKYVLARAKGEEDPTFKVNEELVSELLGVPKYRDRTPDRTDRAGTVNGLAWTSTGGAILQIDVAVMEGKSNFRLTGKLGDVMKESAQAALTYIRSHASKYGIAADFFDKHELHIHIPEGAIPKDGPSAGMAMVLAMLSLLTGKRVRHDVGMTGEITLRGDVLAIGGLNEKLLAAQRNKLSRVLIPKDNEPDLTEIPAKVKDGLEIIPVSTVTEAISQSFRDPLEETKD
ncbi:serine peptidase, MEROPS family S16 [Cyclonatronum proteinivorum]|uniref:Lon protease n=1 Tax=Cyclonatronum proteinivorum TaxID=1457365 RepID=A0A345UNF1_9BACT|nr:endopeptidase La [Cyclonatronum proteinivorum]AXJ02003.1 serine peptidase, MEROPS family S16 [Cyclonatronum proteinivorum]